jgi:hypothetical protein
MRRRWLPVVGLSIIFLGALYHAAYGFDTVGPTQAGTSRNQTASAIGTNAVSITGVTNQRVRLYGFSGQCASGAASITITNGGTTIWSATGILTTTPTMFNFGGVPLMGSAGSTMAITASLCFNGGGASTLNIHADQY